MEQAAERADRRDFQAAAQLVARTRDFWERHHGFFGIALRHAESDTINSTFRELLEYAENECTEEFEPTCADLIAQIRHLSDMEKPIITIFWPPEPLPSHKRQPGAQPFRAVRRRQTAVRFTFPPKSCSIPA